MNTEELIGLTKDEAIRKIEDVGFRHRITNENGKSFIVTMDLRVNRINLRIENGKVVAADIG